MQETWSASGWLAQPSIQHLLGTASASFDRFGYLITFAGSLLENTVLLGAFLPGTAFLLVAAGYARQGLLLWPAVLFLGWIGSVLGNVINFWLGRSALLPLLRRRDVFSFNRHAATARTLLARHGAWAVMLSHIFGPLRCFVAITAGSVGFSFGRFLAFEAAAALLWNLVFSSLGYFAAGYLDTIHDLLQRGAVVGLALTGAAILALWMRRRLQGEIR